MNVINWKNRFFRIIRSINWKRGFFRITLVVSILGFILGIYLIIQDYYDPTYGLGQSPFEILLTFSGFPWLVYIIVRWPIYFAVYFVIKGFKNKEI